MLQAAEKGKDSGSRAEVVPVHYFFPEVCLSHFHLKERRGYQWLIKDKQQLLFCQKKAKISEAPHENHSLFFHFLGKEKANPKLFLLRIVFILSRFVHKKINLFEGLS